LQQAYGEDAMSRTQVFDVFRWFKEGRTSFESNPHLGGGGEIRRRRERGGEEKKAMLLASFWFWGYRTPWVRSRQANN
jgi:hypothetical protein